MHQQHTQSQQLPSQAASTSCTGTNKATNTEIPAPMEQMGVRLINPNSKNTPGKTSYHKSYLANPHTIYVGYLIYIYINSILCPCKFNKISHITKVRSLKLIAEQWGKKPTVQSISNKEWEVTTRNLSQGGLVMP